MKRTFLSSYVVAALAISFAACNNTGTTSETGDSSNSTTTNSTNTSATTPMTSEGNYAAMADSVERNSQQGYYLNAKTGKPYSSLKVDRSTGRVTDEAGEPVWRYVDSRNWWVYGDDNNNWTRVGEAKMEGNKLMYKGDDDKWVDYDTRWKVSDDGMKQKMTTESGDKIKMKTDEEGNTKIKVNDEKVKVDKDGKPIKN